MVHTFGQKINGNIYLVLKSKCQISDGGYVAQLIGGPRSILGVRTSTLLRLLPLLSGSPLLRSKSTPSSSPSPPTPPHEKGHKISPRGSCPTTQRWRSGGKSFPHVRRGGSRRRRRIPAFCYRSSHSLPRRHRRDLISSSPGNLPPSSPPSSLPSSFFNFDVQTKNFQAVDRDGYQLKQSE